MSGKKQNNLAVLNEEDTVLWSQ